MAGLHDICPMVSTLWVISRVLAPKRAEAAAAARSGIPLKRVLDRALSAGWVVWAAATRLALPAEVLAALGDALLRTGDAAAAALSDGHESAERELARRSGAALRELLDGLLELDGADLEGRARLGRRLADLGIASDRRVSVALVATEVELSDDAVPWTAANIADHEPALIAAGSRVELVHHDATTVAESGAPLARLAGQVAVIVTNPPYGVRLEDSADLATFYPKLGDVLKKKYAGWTAYILSADMQLPKKIGLAASKRTPLRNGDVLVMCTDGLWSVLTREEVATWLTSTPILKSAPEMMIHRIVGKPSTCRMAAIDERSACTMSGSAAPRGGSGMKSAW